MAKKLARYIIEIVAERDTYKSRWEQLLKEYNIRTETNKKMRLCLEEIWINSTHLSARQIIENHMGKLWGLNAEMKSHYEPRLKEWTEIPIVFDKRFDPDNGQRTTNE